VAVDTILTAQQFLTMSLTQLAEIPQRVNFSKQRVAQVRAGPAARAAAGIQLPQPGGSRPPA
jgi:hypothetical protein